MSWNPYTAPLRVRLNPSPMLAALLLAMHSGAILPLWLVQWPGPIDAAYPAMLLTALIAWHGAWATRRYIWLADADFPREFVVFQRELEYPGGLSAEILPASQVHPQLTILHLRLENGRKRYIPIFADTLDAETFRLLRVRVHRPHHIL